MNRFTTNTIIVFVSVSIPFVIISYVWSTINQLDVEREVLVNVPSSYLYNILIDFEKYPRWNSIISYDSKDKLNITLPYSKDTHIIASVSERENEIIFSAYGIKISKLLGVGPGVEYYTHQSGEEVDPTVNLTEVLLIKPSNNKDISQLINLFNFKSNKTLAPYTIKLGNIIKVIEDFNQDLKKYAESSYNQ